MPSSSAPSVPPRTSGWSPFPNPGRVQERCCCASAPAASATMTSSTGAGTCPGRTSPRSSATRRPARWSRWARASAAGRSEIGRRRCSASPVVGARSAGRAATACAATTPASSERRSPEGMRPTSRPRWPGRAACRRDCPGRPRPPLAAPPERRCTWSATAARCAPRRRCWSPGRAVESGCRRCSSPGSTGPGSSPSPRVRSKVEAVQAAGAHEVVVSPGLDFAAEVRRRTGGAGVDVAIEIVGSPTFAQTLRCMASGGRVVVVGNVDTGLGQLNPGLLIVKELEILGAYATTAAELDEALGCSCRGELRRTSPTASRSERRPAPTGSWSRSRSPVDWCSSRADLQASPTRAAIAVGPRAHRPTPTLPA